MSVGVLSLAQFAMGVIRPAIANSAHRNVKNNRRRHKTRIAAHAHQRKVKKGAIRS